MRTTRTFILRLLVDNEDPTALRGALYAVGELQARAFASPARLLELLQQITAAGTSWGTPQKSASETQPSIPAENNQDERSCSGNTLIA